MNIVVWSADTAAAPDAAAAAYTWFWVRPDAPDEASSPWTIKEYINDVNNEIHWY